jgi:hypothetical protein
VSRGSPAGSAAVIRTENSIAPTFGCNAVDLLPHDACMTSVVTMMPSITYKVIKGYNGNAGVSFANTIVSRRRQSSWQVTVL